MPDLDELIQPPVRIHIMSALTSLEHRKQIDFSCLTDKLDLIDGNLSAHLRALTDAGYLTLEKTFAERRPKTFVAASAAGRNAFATHVAAPHAIIKPS